MADFDRESMLEMFTFEMNQLIEQLEQCIINGESGFSMEEINDIFRIMHTVKGSAAMMMFDSITNTAHSMEDLFFYLREESPENVDYSTLADLILEGMDFIKLELDKVQVGHEADGECDDLISRIKAFLANLKGVIETPSNAVPEQKPIVKDNNLQTVTSRDGNQKRIVARIRFEQRCEMENVRCFTLLHNLEGKINDVVHVPEDIIDENAAQFIKQNGFKFEFTTDMSINQIKDEINKTPFLESVEVDNLNEELDTTNVSSVSVNNNGNSNHFSVSLLFDENTEMENVRCYTIVYNLEKSIKNLTHEPKDLFDENSANVIKVKGFNFEFDTFMTYDEISEIINGVAFLREFSIKEGIKVDSVAVDSNIGKPQDPVNIETKPELPKAAVKKAVAEDVPKSIPKKSNIQHVISVNVSKLDQLVNFMGELVIAEAMVTQNPELDNLILDSFHKETRQLRKIINNLQDTVMSMRMVPLSPTFFKMNRLVRDMCKQLNKEVELEIIGDDTEVDKNIIEHIADPLMHIIRNSIDHGIEMPATRKANGKPEKGIVTLEAKNSGGDVLIIIKDNGAGIKTSAVLEKAFNNGLLKKPKHEYSDKEIHQFIFLPGFSTNEEVTSYSGRGVGMDVVSTNLEVVGGSVLVESVLGEGSIFTLKIPLTLAIIDGMIIKVGGDKYTIPIVSIKQSFKARPGDVFLDPDGNEMISLRGEVYNVIRLYQFFNIQSEVTQIEDGIMILIEDGERTVCVFSDELIGEQQVVVKTMPKYINRIRGLSGCTLIGNGDISLIIDVAGIFDK
jgi:two-component system, chemotaxis family, sensor kinase CheA